jgi:hypothetical protein
MLSGEVKVNFSRSLLERATGKRRSLNNNYDNRDMTVLLIGMHWLEIYQLSRWYLPAELA